MLFCVRTEASKNCCVLHLTFCILQNLTAPENSGKT